MTGIERVTNAINHKRTDRIPFYGWVKENLKEPITEQFGSVENFEDRYEFDLSHLFGGPSPYKRDLLEEARSAHGGTLEPADLLELPMNDPLNEADYESIKDQLDFYQRNRQRFCYMQTPGIFEANNGNFGIENHLAYLLLYPEDMKRVYERQAEWNKKFAGVCMDLGVNMIHISDDWGAQNSLLFNPQIWHEMIAPNIKITADYVRSRNCFLSLHSDGNINGVLPGIRDLGFDVLHPFQESAGMDFQTYLKEYRNDLIILGGMDIQTTIGFGKIEWAKGEIKRVVETFKEGGLMLCTSHYVQDHCSMEELVELFDYAYKIIRT
jgi:uroporphyrinogen decarboxylase